MNWLTICHRFVLSSITDKTLSDYASNMADVLLETGTTTLHQHPGSPCFYGGVSVAHLFRFLCCVFCFVCHPPVSCMPNIACVSGLSSSCVLYAQYCMCLWIVFLLCLVCPMLHVSLDCPLLIALSVFSNVYLSPCLLYVYVPPSVIFCKRV